MLENELDEKQRMGEMCHRLKDEVRGILLVMTTKQTFFYYFMYRSPLGTK